MTNPYGNMDLCESNPAYTIGNDHDTIEDFVRAILRVVQANKIKSIAVVIDDDTIIKTYQFGMEEFDDYGRAASALYARGEAEFEYN